MQWQAILKRRGDSPTPSDLGTPCAGHLCVLLGSQAYLWAPSFSLFCHLSHSLPASPDSGMPFSLGDGHIGGNVGSCSPAATLQGNLPGSWLMPPFPRSQCSSHHSRMESPCQLSLSGFCWHILALCSVKMDCSTKAREREQKGGMSMVIRERTSELLELDLLLASAPT